MMSRRIGLLIISTLFILNCGNWFNSGTSTETENSVAFRILDSQGQPVQNASYRIRPLWYLTDTTQYADSSAILFEGISDSKGWIHIKNQPSGSFVIELIDDSLSGALIYTHEPSPTKEIRYTLEVQPAGSVIGQVQLPDSVDYAWVQVYGLDFVTRTDSIGIYEFHDLPVGELHLVAWNSESSSPLGTGTVRVISGDTVDMGQLSVPTVSNEILETWRYERKILAKNFISDWMSPIQFPNVVTVRLDSSNFDFTQSLANGRDIRLVNANGDLLQVERVRWDSSARRAYLRVRIESLSDTLAFWSLKWGNTQAVNPAQPNVWQGLSDSLRLVLNSILIDDFERVSNRNALIEPIAPSFWYMGMSDSGVIAPNQNDSFATAYKPAGDGRSGQAAHFTYEADYPEWVHIGTSLGYRKNSLATMDSIVFWYKGDGTYSVAFEYLDSNLVRKAMYNGVANDTWTRVRVRPSDLVAADSIGGNYGWNFVKDRITNLTFFANNGAEFWIDDIRLYGVNRDDFVEIRPFSVE